MEVLRNQEEHRIRQRLLEEANILLGEKGLYASLLEETIARASFTPRQAIPYFASNRALVFALYLRQASEWESTVAALAPETLANRFRAAMLRKLEIVEPHREAIRNLLITLANPRDSLGVFHPQTELVRSRGLGIMTAVLQGATDVPKCPEKLAHTLYIAHLALMLLWSKDSSRGFKTTHAAIARVASLLSHPAGTITLRTLDTALSGAARGFTALLGIEPERQIDETSRRILKIILRHRRLLPGKNDCAAKPCEACFSPHLPALHRFVSAGMPVHLVLPAFPAKSPGPHKVLGKLPDMAEEIGLRSLHRLCEEIGEVYPPGARITICSDGHVFADQVGVSDEDVRLYNAEINRMISSLSLNRLDTFSMKDVFSGLDYEGMRQHLCLHYAESPEKIHERCQSGPYAVHFNGVHRFLFEDQLGLEDGRSRTAIRNETKNRAYEVIRRSDAWSRLLADCFGASIRLSIHPQPSHAEKIGILLGAAEDLWITPWHGVAFKEGGEFILLHRHEAELRGGQPVLVDGRPYYYESEAKS